jgi:hypothetical protein
MQNIQWEILLGTFGLIISIIYMHQNSTSRIDSLINKTDQKFEAMNKEIMELIKKIK